MSEVRVIKITPLEPIMLRGPGEYDPSVRGITSWVRSLTWPSPSTLAGFLLTNLIQYMPKKSSNWLELLRRYEELMEGSGLKWVRGPYFVDEHEEIYVPLLLREILLINLKQLRHYFNELLRGFEGYRITEVVRAIREYVIKPKYHERVGISLRSREGMKVVREGYFYSTTFTHFPGGGFSVEVGVAGDISTLNSCAATFGGEGRAVRVDVDGEVRLVRELPNFTNGYVVLLSPLVLPAINVTLVERSGEIRVNNYVIAKLVSGRISVRGLGYAIAEHVRKPIYPTVLEGSILYLKECSSDVKTYGAYACFSELRESLFWERAKVLGALGFGSFAILKSE